MDFLFNTNVQFFIAAYLAGGIPFGLILAKKFAGVNIKAAGSGSIGATNVLRVVKEKDPSLAKKLGIATLGLDAIMALKTLPKLAPLLAESGCRANKDAIIK